MKKRILALIAVIALATATLCSCKQSSKDTSTPTVAPSTSADTKTTDTKAASGDSEDYPVIRLAYTRMFSTDSEPKVEAAMNEILRETAHAEVDLVAVDFGSMQTQFNLLLTGGSDSIDIFSSFWYMPLSTLCSNGQLAPLDDLITSEAPEVLDLFADYPEVLDCCKVNGKMYALPTVGPYSSPMIYIVKETDSKSANIDWKGIDTLDKVTEALVKMKEANPSAYYVPAATETYWVPKDIDYFGDTLFLGVLTDPLHSTTVENYYESDYFYNFLENVKVWQDKEILSPDSLSNTNPTLMSIQYGITNGTPGYGWDLDEWIYEANYQQTYGDNMTGCQIGDRLITTGNITTYLWHITSFCENKEAAMRVLAQLYLDPRLDNLLGNGIEGENYVVNADGRLEFPEGKDMTNCGWTGIGATYSLPNASGCPIWYYQPDNMWDMIKESNKEAKPSLALGFTFDSSNVADQVTACSNVIAQYYLPLINGEVDIDETLPVFQQELHNAGIDAIIAEKQAQLDAWLANK